MPNSPDELPDFHPQTVLRDWGNGQGFRLADALTLDGLFASEVQAEVVKHFEQGATAEERQQTLEETAGIPTGLAPDIHKQVELRRAKQRKPAPDNLAPETPEGRA